MAFGALKIFYTYVLRWVLVPDAVNIEVHTTQLQYRKSMSVGRGNWTTINMYIVAKPPFNCSICSHYNFSNCYSVALLLLGIPVLSIVVFSPKYRQELAIRNDYWQIKVRKLHKKLYVRVSRYSDLGKIIVLRLLVAHASIMLIDDAWNIHNNYFTDFHNNI